MFLSFKDNRLKIRILCFIKSHAIIAAWETKEPGGFPSYSGGADPPDERKEGVANVCYICGFNPNWNIHCHPYRVVLYNLQG